MSSNVLLLTCALVQAVVAVLLFLKIDVTVMQRIGLGSRARMSTRDKIISVLLVGTFVFNGLGFYLIHREGQPAGATEPANIEASLRQWLDNFQLASQRVDDSQSDFTLLVTLGNKTPIYVRHLRKLDRYLTLQSLLTLSAEDKSAFEKLPVDQMELIIQQVHLEIARAKIGCVIDLPLKSLTLSRRVPITDLTEAVLMEHIDEVDFGVNIARDVVHLLIRRSLCVPSAAQALQ